MADGTRSANATRAVPSSTDPPPPTHRLDTHPAPPQLSSPKPQTPSQTQTDSLGTPHHLLSPHAPSPRSINQRHVPTSAELVELRAAQRTFEGAYLRTALGQFSFALIVLKIFTSEFYPVGALFAVYGVGILVVAGVRRREGRRQFFREEDDGGEELNDVGWGGGAVGATRNTRRYRVHHRRKFRTSGNVVVFVTALSIAAYISLMVLVLRMDNA